MPVRPISLGENSACEKSKIINDDVIISQQKYGECRLQSNTYDACSPLTYAAIASGVSLSGSMVMRSGVKSGRVFILSVTEM